MSRNTLSSSSPAELRRPGALAGRFLLVTDGGGDGENGISLRSSYPLEAEEVPAVMDASEESCREVRALAGTDSEGACTRSHSTASAARWPPTGLLPAIRAL
eukprot:CAMPEP_0204407906 /NCGR_PEP_ID=MMETSP0470-20130426/9078_1 /ASSEMBLY_ACC=CAM_ASM_000385 /TAXON_ID=2969 /ORGANISM="Oxyrrhis marina" /LENGTH=101 /DNA_ID=CAMNT_0051403601 /DNA_START=330 /DNA_END=633 /DNA_ORIENTATION=+